MVVLSDGLPLSVPINAPSPSTLNSIELFAVGTTKPFSSIQYYTPTPILTTFGYKDNFGITKYTGQISNKYVPPFRQIAENYFISRGE
jgi:hypothetical protein